MPRSLVLGLVCLRPMNSASASGQNPLSVRQACGIRFTTTDIGWSARQAVSDTWIATAAGELVAERVRPRLVESGDRSVRRDPRGREHLQPCQPERALERTLTRV